jgi:xanthine/CO dehydrogenase XdhC/CoxF family maturation factor
MFRALSNRDYRLFWIGAFLSNVGTWMQAVAQGWLVLLLTNSPFWLGLDAFMATAPGFIFTLVGGVFADLIDRRRLLLITQVIAGAAALGLATLVLTNSVNRYLVLGFSFVTGCCMALASPSFLAMTYDLVGREDLANAIAMNSTQFQLARVVGPALAGVAFRVFGLAGCFFANGVSFIAVVASLAVVTRGHSEDEQCMRAVVQARPDYMGLIGSKRRTTIVIDRLREAGADEAELRKIRAPIGLDIGAVSPEEVALAIMAEIVAERRGATGGSLSAWRRK